MIPKDRELPEGAQDAIDRDLEFWLDEIENPEEYDD